MSADESALGNGLDLKAEVVLAATLEVTGPKQNATAGEPIESELVIYKDSATEVGIWEVTPGEFLGHKSGAWEYMHFVQGAGTITDESGNVTEIGPGVVAFAPDGWRGTWRVTATVRKTYVISASPGADR
jgi:uncharacterized cupin superfamily protein